MLKSLKKMNREDWANIVVQVGSLAKLAGEMVLRQTLEDMKFAYENLSHEFEDLLEERNRMAGTINELVKENMNLKNALQASGFVESSH